MDIKASKNYKIKNMSFFITIFICIVILITFIVLAISMILARGLPSLIESLFIEEIQFSIKLSLYTSIISTLFCIVLAIPISYGLARFDFKGKNLVNTMMNIPIALPPIVSGVALLILFGNTAFGHFLSSHGLKFVFTVKGIILAQFFVNVPYIIRIMKSTFNDIDPRLEFVSRTLGYNRFQTFLKVTFPLAKNGLVASIVITWARALGEFGAALMLAGATRMKTETLPVSLFLNMSCGDLELAMASATIIIIISIFSLLAFELLGGKQYVITKGAN